MKKLLLGILPLHNFPEWYCQSFNNTTGENKTDGLLQDKSLAQPQSSEGRHNSDLNGGSCAALTLLYSTGSVPLI